MSWRVDIIKMIFIKRKLTFLVLSLCLIIKISAQNNFAFECKTLLAENQKCLVINMSNVDKLITYLENNYNSYYHYMGRVKSISFRTSIMSEIVSFVFTTFTTLESFDASGVELLRIQRNDFKNAGAVKEINLSKNNLTTLGNMVFSSLKSLQTLDLSNNAIESFHDGAFDECSKNLRSVNLSFNKVKQMKLETFISLSAIKYIALFIMKLKKFPNNQT